VGKSPDLGYGSWGFNWATHLGNQAIIARGVIEASARVKVEEIYAGTVVIGSMCKVGRIFGDNVTLESGSIAEQVVFTNELKMDFGSSVSLPPQKVSALPKPPF
jgi:hypothetical protein